MVKINLRAKIIKIILKLKTTLTLSLTRRVLGPLQMSQIVPALVTGLKDELQIIVVTH